MRSSIIVKIILVTVVLFLMPANTSYSKEEGGGGILYGKNFSYIISAPKGWVFDNESGASQGLHAVIYPKGKSWENAPAAIYSKGAQKKEGETITKFINNDFEDFKKNSPNIKMDDYSKITTGDNREAVVKMFSNDKWGNYELVAYIDMPKAIGVIVLTSRDKKSFDNSTKAFEQVVKSFKFLTDDLKFRDNPTAK